MEWISDPQIWIALLTLTILEVVLGIDNIIFIIILSGKLPQALQRRARSTGLALAMLMRIALLFLLTTVMKLVEPWFQVLGEEISGRDMILLVGGLFLVAKSTFEIHGSLEGSSHDRPVTKPPSFAGAVTQIILLDIVFSLDSVITAVGMTDILGVMIAAVVIAVILMLLFVEAVSSFVQEHPSIKMLALSFLLLIGVSLIAEAFDQHVPKGYIYFSMGFSIFVEMLNLRLRKKSPQPVQLRAPSLKPNER